MTVPQILLDAKDLIDAGAKAEHQQKLKAESERWFGKKEIAYSKRRKSRDARCEGKKSKKASNKKGYISCE